RQIAGRRRLHLDLGEQPERRAGGPRDRLQQAALGAPPRRLRQPRQHPGDLCALGDQDPIEHASPPSTVPDHHVPRALAASPHLSNARSAAPERKSSRASRAASRRSAASVRSRATASAAAALSTTAPVAGSSSPPRIATMRAALSFASPPASTPASAGS